MHAIPVPANASQSTSQGANQDSSQYLGKTPSIESLGCQSPSLQAPSESNCARLQNQFHRQSTCCHQAPRQVCDAAKGGTQNKHASRQEQQDDDAITGQSAYPTNRKTNRKTAWQICHIRQSTRKERRAQQTQRKNCSKTRDQCSSKDGSEDRCKVSRQSTGKSTG